MTLSCIIFKYKPYSDILDTLEPFFFSVCVNPYSQINLYFQHNSSTLLLLSHSCLHQPFRLQTQKTRARPSHQESEDSVRRGQAHLFRTQKISSKKTKQKWTNEPWGCKTETQAGHMPTCVPQQLLTDSDCTAAYSRRCCCFLLGIDEASPWLLLWLGSFIYQHLCCTFYAGWPFTNDFCSITSALVTWIYLPDPSLYTNTRELECLGTLRRINPSTRWFNN